MADLPFHEAAGIFPLAGGPELDELVRDIKEHGLEIPIETLNGQIIDGRRRYLACKKADVEPDIVEVDPEDPMAYVLSLNLHRRHLSPGQLSLVGALVREIQAKAANERQREGRRKGGETAGRGRKKSQADSLVAPSPPSNAGKARDKAGALVGVSGKSVDRGTAVVTKGAKQLVEAVKENRLDVSTAAQLTALPKPEQIKALKGGKEAIKAAIGKNNAAGLPEGKTPHQQADEDPERRWHASLHKLYVLMNSTRDLGGIQSLTTKWTRKGKDKWLAELKRIIGELQKWIRVLEKDK